MRGLFALFVLALGVAGASADTLDEGELGGAKFTVARPAQWNGRLLLLAHGYRAETAPLVADLFPGHAAYRALLDEGWMIAKTSYRRNGTIISDAVADLDALRAHLAETYGKPKRVILEGESMGGLIVTLIAERKTEDPPLYHGAVAIGAALSLRESGGTLGLTLTTQLPLIFLTNRSEISGPKNYVRPPIALPREMRPITPVVFRVNRDGHVNVNQAERLAALRALNAWIDAGHDGVLPKPTEGAEFFDATVTPQPGPSQVEFDADRRGFKARVVEISAVYGNVAFNAQPEDFATAGIARNEWFAFTAQEETRRAFFGRDLNAVRRGEWVAFPNADGFFWLARNFENAATTARLKVGDAIHVRSYEGAPPAAHAEQPRDEHSGW
jgi:pimeloyl-ACP methyl ester carboxylesterase